MKMLLLSLVAFSPAGMMNPPPGVVARVYVRVDVDAQGVIQDVRFREGTGERLQSILRERVKSWRFDPASVQGKPAAAQTTVTIELKPGADGQSLDLAGVSAGVAPLKVVAPRYQPPAGNTVQRGSVVLRCKVTADGRCRDISVERATAPELLQKNAMTALGRWRFETEIVAGVAVEPWVLIPFCFSPDRYGAPPPECASGEAHAVAGTQASQLTLRDPLAWH